MSRIEKLLIFCILGIIALACTPNNPPATSQNSSASNAQAEESERDKLKDLCPKLDDILPDGWQYIKYSPLNIVGDEKAECVLFYRYDITTNNQGPIGAVVYHMDDAKPPSLTPYNLLPNDGETLCEHSCTAELKDVLSGWSGDELLIKDEESGYTVQLAVFRWNPEAHSNGNYDLIKAFSGINIEVSQDQVVECKPQSGLSQICSKETYLPNAEKQSYVDNASKIELDFCKGELENPTLSSCPEKVVLSFYQDYMNKDISNYFTKESGNTIGQCNANQCGCNINRINVSYVQVRDLVPQAEYGQNAEQADVTAFIICETESCQPNCQETQITWHLTRVGDHWKLDNK